MREERRRKRIIKRLLIALAVLAVLVIVGAVLMKTVFIIKYTEIEGCVNSDSSAVMQAVSSEEYSDNSLILWYQLKSGMQPDVPFVESVSLSLVSPWRVCIKVSEKTVFGCMYDSTDGTYTYFDSDGTVVEISLTQVPDTIELQYTASGDASDYPDASGDALHDASGDADTEIASAAAEGEKLPVSSSVLKYLMKVCSLIEQYEMDVYIVYFDTSGNIFFHTSGITVELGSNTATEEKFEHLAIILPQLEGKSGTLDFSAFETSGDDVIFTEY